MPGIYLMYHADSRKAGVEPGAVVFTAPAGRFEGGRPAVMCESAFALAAKEGGNIERRGRFELGAGARVVGRRDR